MKLAQTSKKAKTYSEQIKDERSLLIRELAKRQRELSDAHEIHAHERATHDRLKNPRHGADITQAAADHWATLEAASQRAAALTSEVEDLITKLRPLERAIEVPAAFAQAERELSDVRARHKAGALAGAKTEAVIAQLTQRIAALAERIATETKAATDAMLTGGADFAGGETIAKLELELRVATAALTELRARHADMELRRQALTEEAHSSTNNYRWRRADRAEYDATELLQPAMEAIARSVAARRQVDDHHPENRFIVDIPRELIDEARSALDSELGQRDGR